MLTITRPIELRDDDTPGAPDCNPLDSAQARRAHRLPVVITDLSALSAPAAPAGRPRH